MRPQQREGKRRRVKSILASDQVKWRSIRQLIALVRSDLMARRTLVLGDILSTPCIRGECGRREESHGYQNRAKHVHAILSIQFQWLIKRCA